MAKATLTNEQGKACEVNDTAEAFTINDPSAGGLLTYAANDDGEYVSAHSGRTISIESNEAGDVLFMHDPGTIPHTRQYTGDPKDIAKLLA